MDMPKLHLLEFLLLISISSHFLARGLASKILMFSHNKMYSHFALKIRMANTLAEEGHSVDLYFGNSLGEQWKMQLKEEGFHPNVSPKPVELDPELGKICDSINPGLNWTIVTKTSSTNFYWDMVAYKSMAIYYELCIKMDCVAMFGNKNYNLGIAEIWDIGAFALFHRIGLLNYVSTSAPPLAHYYHELLGLPLLANLPERFSGGRNSQGKYLNDSENADNVLAVNGLYRQLYKLIHQKFYINQQVPPIEDLIKKARLILVNTPDLDEVRIPQPILKSKIKFIGGLGVNLELMGVEGTIKRIKPEMENKNEQSEKNKFIEDRMEKTDCVIVFSLGTLINFNSLAQEKLKIMLKTFASHEDCLFVAKIPRQIIEGKEIENKLAGKTVTMREKNIPIELDEENGNILLSDWIPQQKWLVHKNVKLIISHCGQNSLNEALFAGVPIICIPFFGDQFYNAATVVYAGVGVWVQHDKIESEIGKALDKIVGDKKISTKAKNIGRKLRTLNIESEFKNKIKEVISTAAEGKNRAKRIKKKIRKMRNMFAKSKHRYLMDGQKHNIAKFKEGEKSANDRQKHLENGEFWKVLQMDGAMPGNHPDPVEKLAKFLEIFIGKKTNADDDE